MEAQPRHTLILSALAAALPGTLAGIALDHELGAGGLLNPDSSMRLARILDILRAGAPLHQVVRDNSGTGAVLHWSHLLDSLLLLLAAPLAPLLGWPGALAGAAPLAGPLSLAGLGAALGWAVRPFAPRGWAWMAAAVAGAAPSVAGYGLTGVVHHHVLLAVAATMAAGWALRLLNNAEPPSGGLFLGAWAAAGIWLSPETLPFSLMAMGALWLAWLQTPCRRLGTALASCGLSFAGVVTASWLADPPMAGLLSVEPDRLSVPFVLLAAVALLLGVLARASGNRPAVVGFGVLAAGFWLLLFPGMLRGSEALLPRKVADAMFGAIREMQPVRGAWEAAETLGGGLFAVAVLLLLVIRRPAVLPLHAAACAVVLVVLAAVHVRFATYPAILGAALLPLAIGWVSEARIAPSVQAAARLGLVLPLLLGPVLIPAPAEAGAGGAACAVSGAVALLAPFPGRTVLSDVNLVPDLLYRTRVRTVGSLFHRTPAGFMRLRAAWRSRPDEAGPGPELLLTGASLLLACPGAPRSALVDTLPHQTLLDRVTDGQPPAWLHRVADAGPGGYVLYAVVP